DPIRDRQALNRMKLQADVQSMWQRERGTPSVKGEPIPINDEQRLIQHLYEAHKKKTIPSAVSPTVDAPAKPPTHEDMKQVLMAAMPLDEEALRNLARQR